MNFMSTRVAHAAENPAVRSVIQKINEFILNPVIGFLFALAFIFFLWGAAEFLFQADSEAAREKGKQHMIWGLVGMFIMFAAFAIIRLIASTIGVDAPGLP
ncbi:hypothetical protein CL630_02925 [bacterium]|nr:hypothetical protein [bacterium]|tara:strand:+ start:689 stop:991 length:303 start_codon:yes stop_codon:yes gene_type:complete